MMKMGRQKVSKYVFKEPKPTRYQVATMKKILKHKRYGVFYEQRVGKTRVVIDVLGIRAMKKDINGAVIIVCPKSVLGEWEKQLEQYLDTRVKIINYNRLTPTERNNLTPVKAQEYNSFDLIIVLVNYGTLSYRERSIYKKYTHWDNISKYVGKVDTLICDESHLIKSHTSNRNKICKKIASKCNSVILMTGTPLAKAPRDIYGQLKVLFKPGVWELTWADFKNRYCKMGGFEGKQIIGYKNTDELNAIIKKVSDRYLRSQVMREPEKKTQIHTLDWTDTARAMYDQMRKNSLIEFEKGDVTAQLAITRLMRLQQVCSGWVYDDDGILHYLHTHKTDQLKELCSSISNMVVFYRFTQTQHLITQQLDGKNYGVICGATKADDRTQLFSAFQEGRLQYLIVQISAGCMGVKLSKAQDIVFYELDFSLSNYLQARDRVMGRGQTEDYVTYHYLEMRKSVDSYVRKVLEKNQKINNVVLKDYKKLLGG